MQFCRTDGHGCEATYFWWKSSKMIDQPREHAELARQIRKPGVYYLGLFIAVLSANPRNPQRQSSTGHARDGQTKESQCVLHTPFVL